MDIETRIQEIKDAKSNAERKLARLEAQKEQLDAKRKEIMDGFAELEVEPKDAKAELAALKEEIEEKLAEAEAVIEKNPLG